MVEERPDCTVLVVGTDAWAIDRTAAALRAAGMRVRRCQEPNEPAFPCNAFVTGRTCPLDEGFDVVLTARARPARDPEPREAGVVCALRTRHPLVVAGVTGANPYESVAAVVVAEGGDAAAACRRAAQAAPAVVDLRH